MSQKAARRGAFAALMIALGQGAGCSSGGGAAPPVGESSGGGGGGSSATGGSGSGGGAASSTGGVPAPADGGADQNAAPADAAGLTDAQAMVNAPGISLSLYAVIADAVVKRYDPIKGDLNRVEMPPRSTLLATVPAGTRSVEFKVAGARVSVVDAAPFLMNQLNGKASAWAVDPGSYDVSVFTYAAAGAQGSPTGQFAQTIRILRTGMDPGFVAQDDATNLAWIAANMMSVMIPSTYTSTTGHVLPFRLYTPRFVSKDVKYPLLVFLHGSSAKGTDNMNTLTKTIFTGPRSVVSPNMQDQFPAFVLVPQCDPNEEWATYLNGVNGADGSYTMGPQPSEAERATLELIDKNLQELPLDPARVYLTGVSMGGIGVWDFTARRPTLFACGVPMAGFSDRSTAETIKNIPFWIFHGGADMTNPKIGSELMAAKLKMVGDKVVILTEYPGLDHNPTFDKAWTDEPELLPWIFSW
ncbi:MAG TPA: prolyl oligopeptidase family serine peptidase [Polyangia bacterium]|jgi:predicted esterase